MGKGRCARREKEMKAERDSETDKKRERERRGASTKCLGFIAKNLWGRGSLVLALKSSG